MDDDKYREGFGDAAPATDPSVTDAAAELNAEQAAAVEAQAEEDFISAPEDTVNPLVPAPDDDAENRLEGAIGSGNLEADYPDEAAPAAESNEGNMILDSAAETVSEAPATETPVEAAPAEEPVVAAEAPAEAAPAASILGGSEQSAAEAAAPVAAAPKKSKKGLIIGIIITLVVLIGAGVGILLWLILGNNPDKVLGDALVNLYKSENVVATGTLEYKNSDGDTNIATFEISKDGGNIGGSGSIEAEAEGKKITLNFSASYIKGGNAYFMFENLKSLKKIILNGSGSASASAKKIYEKLIDAIVEKVDGQWYKLNSANSKQISMLGDTSCFFDSIDDAMSSESMEKIASVYKEHPFLKVKEGSKKESDDGVDYYTVVIDEDEEKAFSDKAKENDAVKKLYSCTEKSSKSPSDSDEKKSSSTDIEEYRIGIKSGKIVSIEFVTNEGKKTEAKTKLDLTYDKKSVNEPDGARDASKLMEDISSAVIDSFCGSYTGNTRQLCEQTFGNMGIGSMLGGLGGGINT